MKIQRLPLAVFLTLYVCCGSIESAEPIETRSGRNVDAHAFLTRYRISHYLETAESLQTLDAEARAARLRELAKDRTRGSDVFVLCRMFFEAKPEQKFHRPALGRTHFIAQTSADDWPLEPIAIYRGLPILIVTDYQLSGTPQPPIHYVEYCLSNCQWRETKYVSVDKAKRRAIVDEFLKVNPRLNEEGDWLRRQAD